MPFFWNATWIQWEKLILEKLDSEKALGDDVTDSERMTEVHKMNYWILEKFSG